MSAAIVPFRVLDGGRRSAEVAPTMPLSIEQKIRELAKLQPALFEVVECLIDKFLEP